MAIRSRENRKKTETSPLPPSPRSPIAEFIWRLVSEKHGFAPLSETSLKNSARANEILKREALVVYINHTSMNDASVVISLLLSHLTNAVRFMGPAGMKHYDFSRDPKNAFLLRLLRILNVHAIPVVQHDDLEHYSPQKKELLIHRLKREAQRLLKKPRSIYGITPEGKRNTIDGTLLQARPGIGKLEKIEKNLHYLPIVIVYTAFSEEPKVVIGEPMKLEQLCDRYKVDLPNESEEVARAQKITDLLMVNLSRLLPNNLRGYYKNFEISK